MAELINDEDRRAQGLLEGVHLVDRARRIGGFYEQLLDL